VYSSSVFPRRFQIKIGTQPGEMRHQIANGDVAVAALELGQVLRDWIVDTDLALLEEPHDGGRGGDYFG
jgi:hypothetical protein